MREHCGLKQSLQGNKSPNPSTVNKEHCGDSVSCFFENFDCFRLCENLVRRGKMNALSELHINLAI